MTFTIKKEDFDTTIKVLKYLEYKAEANLKNLDLLPNKTYAQIQQTEQLQGTKWALRKSEDEVIKLYTKYLK